jgi:hypothetical protein
MSFHSKDNWFWKRGADGSVTVTQQDVYGNIICFHQVDASTWCSIIASVSMSGDTADSFAQAERLHMIVSG